MLEWRQVLITKFKADKAQCRPSHAEALTLDPVGVWPIELSIQEIFGELLVEACYTVVFQAHSHVVSFCPSPREM